MKERELLEQIEELQDKLNRELRRISALNQKSKYLMMQYADAKAREEDSHEVIMTLLERQRELNVILDRTNKLLNRGQETLALSSTHFSEMAKSLPESQRAGWAERIARIREAFREAGLSDADFAGFDIPALGESASGTRTCPRCGRQTHKSSAACLFCYAPMDAEPGPRKRSRAFLRGFRRRRR